MVEGAMGQYRQLRQTPAPSIFGVDTGPPHEGDTGQGVVLHTTLGPIKAILHQSAEGGVRAVLWVWGARGGYTGPAHVDNLLPYQGRAQQAGPCGVEVEGGRVPTRDWFLNLPSLTSGGLR